MYPTQRICRDGSSSSNPYCAQKMIYHRQRINRYVLGSLVQHDGWSLKRGTTGSSVICIPSVCCCKMCMNLTNLWINVSFLKSSLCGFNGSFLAKPKWVKVPVWWYDRQLLLQISYEAVINLDHILPDDNCQTRMPLPNATQEDILLANENW